MYSKIESFWYSISFDKCIETRDYPCNEDTDVLRSLALTPPPPGGYPQSFVFIRMSNKCNHAPCSLGAQPLLLSTIHLMFIHVVVCNSSLSFLLLSSSPLVDIPQFAYPFTS